MFYNSYDYGEKIKTKLKCTIYGKNLNILMTPHLIPFEIGKCSLVIQVFPLLLLFFNKFYIFLSMLLSIRFLGSCRKFRKSHFRNLDMRKNPSIYKPTLSAVATRLTMLRFPTLYVCNKIGYWI